MWRSPPKLDCGTDATLPAKGDGAGSCADAALGDWSGGRRCQRRSHLLGGDGPLPDRVQQAVVSLSYHGIDRAHLVHSWLLEQVLDHRIGGLPYTEGAGQQDRRLQLAQLGDLGATEQLSKAVADVDGSRHSLQKEIA